MLLLDTNIWFKYYWRLPLPPRLTGRIESEKLALSPVSVLEISTKIRKGHFPGIPALGEWLRSALDGYLIAAATPEIMAAAGSDTWVHQDPADRILVQTARANGFTFAHSDQVMRKRRDVTQLYFKLPSQGE